ncbi:MAG: hypothetical protein D6743_11750 [Calditrichaeota bacterium]|nr:MAG: hypothetical protein D6743_11750 [Calditrichota bacterium]
MMGLFLLHSTDEAFSYPWFARRLVDNCNKCHVAFPKTNDYGWYVKTTGYELPKIEYTGLEESPVKRLLRYMPVAVRFKLDAVNSNPSHMEGDLNIRTAQLISGGSILGNRVSWWFHKHLIEKNEFEDLFGGLPHEMWAQYNWRLGKSDATRFSIRYGMSELPLRFSPAKTDLSEMEYAIYNAMAGESSLMLSMPQYGVGLKGVRLGGPSFNQVQSTYDIAFVNGAGNFSSNRFTEVFGRVGTLVGRTMVGAFTYVGAKDLAMAHHHEEGAAADSADAGMEESMFVGNNFYRVGVDFDSNVSPEINVYGLAMYARDSNPLAQEVASAGRFYGGFLGIDYTPSERVVFSWRYDMVRFNDFLLASNSEHADEHADNPADPDAGMHMEEEGGHTHGGGGHMHGEMVTSNTDAMVFGVHFLLPIPNYQMRLTSEFRLGFRGQSDKMIVGLQFAL